MTKRWIRTFTGKEFYPLEPNPADIDIRDIAHALSNICRFTGHCREFYCVTPEMRILTSDLRWIPAEWLREGDELLGFDEFPLGDKKRRRRKLRGSRVLTKKPVKRHVYKITLSDGTILRSSAEHPWLTATKLSRNQIWKSTEDLFKDLELGRKRYLFRFLKPWDFLDTRDAGYVSGMFDGEGHTCFHYGGISVGMAQKENISLNKVERILTENNIQYSSTENDISGVKNISVRGKWFGKLEFLGLFRPERLIEKVKSKISNDDFRIEFDSVDLLEITSVEYEGEQTVIGLETSSKTYFAEGFGCHNSVGQHSLIVEWLLRDEGLREVDPNTCMWALLHDASEAYIADIARPVKQQEEFSFYKEVESNLMRAVCDKFKLPYEAPKEVETIDHAIVMDEIYDLFGEKKEDCRVVHNLFLPSRTKDMFLRRYQEIEDQR
jgi:hypothetical protein